MSVLTSDVHVQDVTVTRVPACGTATAPAASNARQLVDEMLAIVQRPQTPTTMIEVRDLLEQLAAQFDATGGAPTKALADVEREHILAVLDSQGWSRHKTAKILGIDVKTLYNKIKKYEASGFVPAQKG